MLHLSAPHAIGEHVYFLRGNTITEGITSECTVKFDGTQVNTIYVVAFIDGDGCPATATMRKNDLFDTRTNLVNSLMLNADQLTPDETAELLKHYDITAPTRGTDAATEPETEPEATLGGVMAEVAQQWREQLNNQPKPAEL